MCQMTCQACVKKTYQEEGVEKIILHDKGTMTNYSAYVSVFIQSALYNIFM